MLLHLLIYIKIVVCRYINPKNCTSNCFVKFGTFDICETKISFCVEICLKVSEMNIRNRICLLLATNKAIVLCFTICILTDLRFHGKELCT